MDINVKCPYCGKTTGYDDSKPFGFCMMCGGKIVLSVKQNVNVPPVASVAYNAPMSSIYGNPNLVISYTSEHPGVYMITTLLSTGASYQYTHGQSMGFTLTPGIHSIDFKIGKRTYRRDVVIYQNTDPVRVLCSWARGTARITIMQAPGNGGSPPILYT